MRRADIAGSLRQYLRPLPQAPHVVALVAPPTPRALDLSQATLPLVTQAARALGQLQGDMARWPSPDLLTRTLARREAVQSSQIEGTKADLRAVLAYEVTRSTNGSAPDVVVTERYVEALQAGLEIGRAHGRSALDLDLVNRMHAILLQDAPAHIPRGAYRDHQVFIGSAQRIEDATFVPAPPEALEGCMRELEQSMLGYAPREDEQTALDIVLQIAIAHAQFETIHPYVDGNGRVGRLLMPLILAAEGLPPLYLSGALLRHRQAYYDALNQVQVRANWDPWVAMLCRAVVESVGDAMAIARDFEAILQGWAPALATFRGDSVARRLPQLLVGYPVVDAARVVQLLDVSDRAARTGIDALVGIGILTPQTQRKRNRVWEAPAVLERLNRPPTPPG